MIKAKNYANGKFHNTEPTTVLKPGNFWSSAYRFLFKRHKERAPRQALPAVVMHDYGRQPASADLRFAWLGHSGVLLELGGQRILIDPVFSERASFLPWAGPKRFQPSPIQAVDLPPVNAVLITHDHYDHLDQPTILALADKTAGFHVPLGVGSILESWAIPKAKIHEYAWWGAQSVDGITLTALPARHFSGRGLFNRDRTLWCGWSLSNDRHRIYHSGDTGMTAGFREIGTECGPFDLAFIKIAAYNDSWPDIHLNPEQAVVALQDLRGQALVPIHWAVFDLSLHSWYEPIERLVTAADQNRAPLITPRMGELVIPSNHENTYWWRPFIPGSPNQS
jgi:L-ascorbate metabolism protein UlaG (beta-lactamase superfamily)